MATILDLDKTLEYCRQNLDLNLVGSEYYYSCLPLCVIDTVFSINTKYKAVENTVQRVCSKFNIKKSAEKRLVFPTIDEQMSISSYLEKISIYSNVEELIKEVYQNEQNTSTINGIRKAEAVTYFLKILQQNNIEYFQDIEKIKNLPNFEIEIKAIKGQGSGVSLKYFLMMTGSDNLIKPDRMIIRFLEAATNKVFTADECQELLTAVTNKLIVEYPELTAQKLDYQIWSFQRNIKKK